MATNALQAVGARLLGCVLNMVPTKGADAYHYYEYSPQHRGARSRQPENAAPSGRDVRGKDAASDLTTVLPAIPAAEHEKVSVEFTVAGPPWPSAGRPPS
jgi:hypothetical protein